VPSHLIAPSIHVATRTGAASSTPPASDLADAARPQSHSSSTNGCHRNTSLGRHFSPLDCHLGPCARHGHSWVLFGLSSSSSWERPVSWTRSHSQAVCSLRFPPLRMSRRPSESPGPAFNYSNPSVGPFIAYAAPHAAPHSVTFASLPSSV
jgi:hypothetical protein